MDDQKASINAAITSIAIIHKRFPCFLGQPRAMLVNGSSYPGQSRKTELETSHTGQDYGGKFECTMPNHE